MNEKKKYNSVIHITRTDIDSLACAMVIAGHCYNNDVKNLSVIFCNNYEEFIEEASELIRAIALKNSKPDKIFISKIEIDSGFSAVLYSVSQAYNIELVVINNTTLKKFKNENLHHEYISYLMMRDIFTDIVYNGFLCELISELYKIAIMPFMDYAVCGFPFHEIFQTYGIDKCFNELYNLHFNIIPNSTVAVEKIYPDEYYKISYKKKENISNFDIFNNRIPVARLITIETCIVNKPVRCALVLETSVYDNKNDLYQIFDNHESIDLIIECDMNLKTIAFTARENSCINCLLLFHYLYMSECIHLIETNENHTVAVVKDDAIKHCVNEYIDSCEKIY